MTQGSCNRPARARLPKQSSCSLTPIKLWAGLGTISPVPFDTCLHVTLLILRPLAAYFVLIFQHHGDGELRARAANCAEEHVGCKVGSV
jgi:hypothetical protein